MEDSITQSQQIEAALRQSEARFQRIAASVPGVIYQFLRHSDGSVTFPFISPSCREIFELEAIEIEADASVLLSMIHPEDEEGFNRSLIQSIETLQPWSWEGRFISASGQIKWIQGASVPERQVTGEILWDGFLMDITAHKQAEEELWQAREELELRVEEALQQSEQKFRSIVENANDIIYQLTPDGIFSYVSPNWVEVLGHEISEVEGKVFTLFVHPDDLPVWLGTLSRAIEHAQNQSGVEYRVLHKDGTWRWYTSNLSLLKDASGSILSVVGIARDISDRKLAEEPLRESEERFRNLVESTNDLIWEVDENAIYTYVTPQIKDILGYDVEEVLGKTPFDFMPSEEASCIHEIMSNQVALRRPLTNLESTNLHKNGHTVILETSGVPFFDKAGNFQGYRGIDRDITKRKQIEEAVRQSQAQLQQQANQLEQTLRQLQNTQAQLIQTEKMSSLGQLVAGIAHEINNPINFIYGNINHARNYINDLLNLITLYQETYPEPSLHIDAQAEEIDLNFVREDFPKLLDSMQVGTERIRGIVRSLRTFSRVDESAVKDVDVHQGLDSTLILLASRLKPPLISQTIQIVKNYSNLPLVKCYPGELNQVFMNLLNNAIDALEQHNRCKSFEEISANPGTIKIRTELSIESTLNPWIVIRITDNGSGMTEEVSSRAFDPFFTTKPVGEGTGLGLAISYQIVVELHKGRLYCISSPGEGAEFVIEIPMQ